MNNRTKIAVVLGVVVIAAGLYLGNSKYNKGAIQPTALDQGPAGTMPPPPLPDLAIGNITMRPLSTGPSWFTLYTQTMNLGKVEVVSPQLYIDGYLYGPHETTNICNRYTCSNHARVVSIGGSIGVGRIILGASSSRTATFTIQPLSPANFPEARYNVGDKVGFVICLNSGNVAREINYNNNCKVTELFTIPR